MQQPTCSLYKRQRDGMVLSYSVLGSRVKDTTPLVLVHGLSSVGTVDWSPLAEELAHSRPVLVFDNRGMGSSVIPAELKDDDYDVQDLANDVIDLVQHLGWQEIDLLGFSLGGMIAQTLLVTPNLPFKVRHAVLAATSAKAAHSDLLSSIPQPSSTPLSEEQKLALITPFVYIGYDPAYVADSKNKPLLDRRVREAAGFKRPSKNMAKQLAVIAGYDVRPKLASIPKSLPVLIIHGRLDRSVYYSESKYITDRIQHAQMAVLPSDQIGHSWYDYFLESSPGFWTNLLNDFLNDKPASVLAPTYKLPAARL